MTFREANQYFKPFWSPEVSKQSNSTTTPKVAELDPLEKIDEGINQLTAETAEDLLERLRGTHPDFFEEAVVQVLLKIGYGGADKRGRRIGGSGDGGVDGVIDGSSELSVG